ncbi:MAG TPA: IS1595 family transposase, partial [Terriglobales bacterium]|nr:IS1595 family transposase [Terriglobales bacterium]
MKQNEPQTLQKAIAYFADLDRAFEYAKELRWPDGKVTCPRCDSPKNSFIKTRRLWFCYGCQKQFTLKVGTVFEDSALGLDKWMTAVWMLVNCRNGVSSYEIARALGITQKSAWFMLQRIRHALQEKSFMKLGSSGTPVEVDETFIGGKARNMHKGRRQKMMAIGRYASKMAVMGMLERGGKVITNVIGDRTGRKIEKIVRENVVPGTEVHTDEFTAYVPLADGYVHKIINHLEGYVSENVHTQGIEN